MRMALLLILKYGHAADFPVQEGDKIVVDPSLKEEASCAGQVTVVVNTHGQVCCIQQLGGLGLTLSQACSPYG